jgi:hypothetical protein
MSAMSATPKVALSWSTRAVRNASSIDASCSLMLSSTALRSAR